MPRLGYRPALDGIRGLAILAVVMFHAFYLPTGGFFGVDLFFVLSGFLITTLLVREWDANGSISLVGFYLRRVRRLLPALVVLLISVIALAGLTKLVDGFGEVDLGQTVHSGLLSLVYSLNVVLAGSHLTSPYNPIVHLWSLAEEEQFYAIWPPLLVLLLAVTRRRFVVIVLLLLTGVAELHLRYASTHYGYLRVYFGPDTHVLPLLGGCLLAFAPRARLGSVASFSALLLFGYLVFHSTAQMGTFTSSEPIVTFASCAIILGAMTPGVFSRALSWGPLALLGRLSYSIYLWHFPLLVVLGGRPKLALLITVAAAAASYRWVERPFRARGTRPGDEPRPSDADHIATNPPRSLAWLRFAGPEPPRG